jgi:rhamnogalacturonan endolyase
MGVWSRSFVSALLAIPAYAAGPFLQQTSNTSWVIGNDLWNITHGPVYGKKLYYKGQDLIGRAVGHYAGWGMYYCVECFL